jgi:DNA helicase TIP49 (TBP-interacting protein)
MWTLGLPCFLDSVLQEEHIKPFRHPKTRFSDEIIQAAEQIKKKFNITGEIKQNFKEQRIEIGDVWITPEQCLDFIKALKDRQ